MQDLFPSPWLVNTLLDEGFIAQQRHALAQADDVYGLAPWLAPRRWGALTSVNAQRLAARNTALAADGCRVFVFAETMDAFI